MRLTEREQFEDRLHEVVNELEKRSVDYRAIGSVAGEATGVFSIDFSPRNEVDAIDRHPDFDIIVPRNELPAAREVRTLFQHHASYPLKLGLAVPAMQVDLRVDQVMSRLTWGRHAIPVESSTLSAQQGAIGAVSVRTVSAQTLRHLYGCMSPQGGEENKYTAKLALFDHAIGSDENHSDDDPYTPFHSYAKLMQQYTPMSRRTMELFYHSTHHMTPEQRNRFRRVALRLAGFIGWR